MSRWSATGRMIVDGRRSVEGQMKFIIRHQKENMDRRERGAL